MKKLFITIVFVLAVFSLYAGAAQAMEPPSVTSLPTAPPTSVPTSIPTQIPTELPTELPSELPSELPTEIPEELLALAFEELTFETPEPYIVEEFIEDKAPESFAAPLYELQGVVIQESQFFFENMQETLSSCEYIIRQALKEDVSVIRVYELIYSSEDFSNGLSFISGTYTEAVSALSGEKTASGLVEGMLILLEDYSQPLIMLVHTETSGEGIQIENSMAYSCVFLEADELLNYEENTEQPATETPKTTPSPTQSSGGLFGRGEEQTPTEEKSLYSEDHHHDSGSHSDSSSRSKSYKNETDLPVTSGGMQVAVSSILVSVAVALAGLPSVGASAGAGMGTFSFSVQSGGSSSGNIKESFKSLKGMKLNLDTVKIAIKKAASAVWDFLRELILNLRDMLTDEGRSYASGKVVDFMEDGANKQ